jgi:hypothetical protein
MGKVKMITGDRGRDDGRNRAARARFVTRNGQVCHATVTSVVDGGLSNLHPVCGGWKFSARDPLRMRPLSGKANEPPSLFTTCLNHFSHVYPRAFWLRFYMYD